jgi:F-box/leucine-rich repeat protein 6
MLYSLLGCFATKSSPDGLELIMRKWRHSFKEIDFAGTPSEETISLAIKALADDSENDTVQPLRVLDLCGSSVTFESVRLLLRTSVHLQSLNLTSCRALPRGIKRNYATLADVRALREQVLRGKFQEETQ